MTTNHAPARSEVVRGRRTTPIPQTAPQKIKKSYRPETIHAQVQSRASSRATTRPVSSKTNRRHYDIAFSTSKANIRTPGITLPTIGPRLISGILILAMGFLLFTMSNSSTFQVSGAQVTGNERITESEINAALLVIGKPIFSAIPEEIKQNLIKVYPEIDTIEVTISLPNRVIVNLTERIPAIVWQSQDGTSYWIDANGVKFIARGQTENLVTVIAYGDPPPPPVNTVDPEQILPEILPVYIDPAMVTTIGELVGIAPQGATIIYDPAYGLGWQDPRGWLVYFGENTQNVSMKLTVYQAIIDKLSQEGVQPTMISVEYLDAPFYRTQ
jgi:cell division protein FtsQ